MNEDLQPGDVIYIDFPNASFKWANGLKVVLAIKEHVLEIADIDEKGVADTTFISVTGVNNKGIQRTKLKYSL